MPGHAQHAQYERNEGIPLKRVPSAVRVGKHLFVLQWHAPEPVPHYKRLLHPTHPIRDINNEYAADGNRSLLIKADRRLTWKSVHAVMQRLHDNGMSTMLLAVEKEKGGN